VFQGKIDEFGAGRWFIKNVPSNNNYGVILSGQFAELLELPFHDSIPVFWGAGDRGLVAQMQISTTDGDYFGH
jgi:hypothetical protein